MTNTNTFATFEIGKTYISRSVCDHECIFEYEVIGRTAKFVIVNRFDGTQKRYKIKENNEGEYFDDGNYSFHPIVRASHVLTEPEPVEDVTEKPEQVEEITKESEPVEEKNETAEELLPTFIRSTAYYSYYEYLGIEFKVEKRNAIFGAVAKMFEINREFDKMCNEIANGG